MRCRAGGALLRRLGAKDLAAFHAYRQDPEVGRYQGWTATDDTQAIAFLTQMNTAALLQPGVWSQAFMRRVAAIEIERCAHCRIGRWLVIEQLAADRSAIVATTRQTCRAPP
jgi:hypothetical protein